MKKGFVLLLLITSFFTFFTVAYSDGYAVAEPGLDAKQVIRRLSYENFKNIKLLRSAIYNYGGGDAEFDRLVKSYSEASAFYFSREFEKSAKKFQENELEIKEAAQKIATIYKEDTENMQKEIIERDVKVRIKKETSGKKDNPSKQKMVVQSTSSIQQANDLYIRTRYLRAINAYRISKDRLMQYLYIEADDLPPAVIAECSKDSFEKDKCLRDAKNKKRSEVKERYEKIIADVDNKIYVSKEKAK